LWAEFNQPKTAQIKSEKPAETRSGKEPIKQPVKSENIEEIKGPSNTNFEEIKGPTNAEIEQVKAGVETKEEEGEKQPAVIEEKPITNLSDVITAQKQVEALIKLINKTVNENIQEITSEENADKQIEEIDLIRAALVKKQALQNALTEMSGLDNLLTQIKTIRQR
jgi:hypothetical protein